ncbi:hypothetical protein ACFL2Q_07380 [Thermodesulfobacteriota bacterium]
MKWRNLAWVVLALLFVVMAGVAIASGGGQGEEPSPWSSFGPTSPLTWRIINSIVLIGLLIYLLKKPILTYFTDRKAQIEKDLAEALAEKEKAVQTIKEYESKIAGMEQELGKMRGELEKAAATESEKVVANADRMAAKMVEAAKIAAEQEVRKARETLKTEAVELAVNMAETLITEKIGVDDQKNIVEDYLAKVGGMK